MKLILAPHADDEALGCGGLIAKAPWDAAVAVLSDKNDGRMDEFLAARDVLGYDHYHMPVFKTGTLQAEMRALVGYLDGLLRNLKPTELYLPTPGAHQDHIATYEAGLRSARLSYTDGAWYVPNVFLYDIPSYSTDLYTIPYIWNRYEALTDEQMRAKVLAISAYESQVSGAFNPAKLAEEHANYVGARRNVRYAEEYAVVREVRS